MVADNSTDAVAKLVTNPANMPLAFDKPSNHDGKYVNVLYIDGHAKGYAGNFKTCVDVVKFLKAQSDRSPKSRWGGPLSDKDFQWLMKKAKAFDAIGLN